jgi:tRNA (cmo5U34)-methyltransferase
MENFSFATVNNFDIHINNSISNYNSLHSLIIQISDFFIKSKGFVYDIGCSTGKLVHELSKLYPNSNIVGIEKEKNIVKYDNVIIADAAEFDYKENSDLFLSIFTLQFIEIETRKKLIEKIYNSLNFGSALIVAEKIYCEKGIFQEMFTFANYDYKKLNFTNEEILSKEKDLRKIMKPLTEKENIKNLQEAGFKDISKFYQSLNFCAWVAIK